MTVKERRNDQILNGSRRRRIAGGCGASVQEVNQLLKQYRQARQMMRSLTGGGMAAPGKIGGKKKKRKLKGGRRNRGARPGAGSPGGFNIEGLLGR